MWCRRREDCFILPENRCKRSVETEKEVYLRRFGAHTMAKFLACMLVTELFTDKQAKCLIRYARVLGNKSGKCSAPASIPCCDSQSKPQFTLVVITATVTEDEVDPT